jgi:protein-disulfide isomerase
MPKIPRIAFIIMVLASVLLAAGCGGGGGTGTPATTPSAASTPSGARVRIIIYSDLQCPTCHTLYSQIEPKIVEQYVATGKATLETRYVSTKGPASSLAAQAILCAGDQGKAAAYRDSILAAWAKDSADAYTQDRLESAAGALGLDLPAFHSCLAGGKHLQQVSDTTVEAGKAGVSTLPTMFINDTKIEGTKPWVIVSQAIEDQLK